MVDFPEFIPSEFNIKDIDFSKTKFKGVTNNFFGSKFLGTTNFSEAKFIGFSASFTNTKFLKGASFHKANFMYAVFKAEFTEKINFSKSEFIEGASFFSSRFIKGGINFDGAIFKKYSPIFELGPNIKKSKAKFSYKVDPENYDFEVGLESPYKIETEEQELNGVTLRVPKGSILFDPDDPSEQKDDDDS